MAAFNPPRFKKGDPLPAAWVNSVNEALRRGTNIRVGSGLSVRRGPGGQQLAAIPYVARLDWCRTPSAVSGATGTWPSLTASSFTADVYRGDGAGLSLVAEDATVYWRYRDGAEEGKIVPCVDNGDGTYDAILDSCTAVELDPAEG